jgi:elongation factor P hydroxylase
MDLSKFSLSLNKKIIKYCQDIKHRLRNKEFGYKFYNSEGKDLKQQQQKMKRKQHTCI